MSWPTEHRPPENGSEVDPNNLVVLSSLTQFFTGSVCYASRTFVRGVGSSSKNILRGNSLNGVDLSISNRRATN
jgi:hypothetical protein